MKIVTALYELFKTHGRGHYKAFREGLLLPFLALPTEGMKYVIYTNKETYDKYELKYHLRHSCYEVRFKELETSEFTERITAIRKLHEHDEHQYLIDRMLSTNFYWELILEKFNFMLENLTGVNETMIWLDAGLMFNSCNFPWRDYIQANMIKPEYFKHIEQKFGLGFTMLCSDHMTYHYELANKMFVLAGSKNNYLNRVVSAGIWGGDPILAKEIITSFKASANTMLDMKLCISEQECMTLELMKDPYRFNILFFHDWYDYQRPLLEICDKYDPKTYKHDNCTL